MASGKAPVCVHDIGNAIATSPDGTRPLPVEEGSEECIAPPVKIVIACGAQNIELDPSGWTLTPPLRAKDGTVLMNAQLTFYVRLPDAFNRPAPSDLLAAYEFPTSETARELTDADMIFQDVAPGVFAVDHDRLSEAHKRLTGKPAPGTKPVENKE